MCHLAISGGQTAWHEHVTDEDYRTAPEPS
jgi:hypothetical protein